MATSLRGVRYCLACGRPLALHTRADARYCSTRCRVLAHRRRHGSGFTAGDLDRLAEAAGPIAEPLLVAAVQAAIAPRLVAGGGLGLVEALAAALGRSRRPRRAGVGRAGGPAMMEALSRTRVERRHR
jgi:hypothetical protein